MTVINYRSKCTQTNLLMHQSCLFLLSSKWPADLAERGRDNMPATLSQISGGCVFRQELVKDDSSFFLLQSSNTTGLSQFPMKTIPLPTCHQMTQSQYLNMGHMEGFLPDVGGKGHQSLTQENASEWGKATEFQVWQFRRTSYFSKSQFPHYQNEFGQNNWNQL